MKSSHYAIGGGMALDYYLNGEALDEWYSSGRFMPVSVHCRKGEPTLAVHLARHMNDATKIGKDRTSHVWMLANVLERAGMELDVDRVHEWKLFAEQADGKLGEKIMLNLRHLNPGVTNLAVVRISELSNSDAKMIDKSYGVVKYPLLDVPLMPFGHIFSDRTLVSRPNRLFLLEALANGRTMLHVPGGAAYADVPYHFAFKSARTALASLEPPVPHELAAAFQHYNQSSHADVVRSMAEAAEAEVVRAGLSAADVEEKKERGRAPGRFAYERDWLVAQADARSKSLLRLYTAESSRFNVACLVSSYIPGLRGAMMSQQFNSSAFAGTFAEYEAALKALFSDLAARKPANTYRDMYVFRAVDLFDLDLPPPSTVYNVKLPFAIVNPTVCSASINLDVAMGFQKGSPCCMMRIRVTSDYKDILVVEGLSDFAHEREVIFPIDSKFTVTRRRYVRDDDGAQVLVLDCEVSRASSSGGSGRTGVVDVSVARGGGCLCRGGGGGGAEDLARLFAKEWAGTASATDVLPLLWTRRGQRTPSRPGTRLKK